jgi:hypothetical protein
MFLWGVAILILGFAGLLLPMIGMPLRFLSMFGEYRNVACIAVAVIGGVIAFSSMRRDD